MSWLQSKFIDNSSPVLWHGFSAKQWWPCGHPRAGDVLAAMWWVSVGYLIGQQGHVLWSELEQPCKLVPLREQLWTRCYSLLRRGAFERRKLAKTCYHKHNLNFLFLSPQVENIASGACLLASVLESQRLVICSSLGFQGIFNSENKVMSFQSWMTRNFGPHWWESLLLPCLTCTAAEMSPLGYSCFKGKLWSLVS